jgi:hypothetical protein
MAVLIVLSPCAPGCTLEPSGRGPAKPRAEGAARPVDGVDGVAPAPGQAAADAEAPAPGQAAADGEAPVEPETPAEGGTLHLEQVDLSEASPFRFHGRLDVAYVHFASSTNVDHWSRDQVFPVSPGVFAEYRLLDWLFVVGEIEYDGQEDSVEVDQAVFRLDLDELLTLRLGRYYFPFGLEKEYYSPSRNTLVDRPAPFRRVYPGTYADQGLFVEGRYLHHTTWAIGYEAAVTQGLRGIDRDDTPETLEDNNDTPQVGGRIYFQPRPELTLGASYTVGYYDDADRRTLDFFGVDARFELFEVAVRAEYVGGSVEGGDEYADFFRQGWYLHIEKEIEIERRFLHAIVPVFRVDWIDANDDEPDFLDVTRYSLGLATFFREDLQLKLEYSISNERGDDLSNNGFLSQIVFHW